MNTDNIAVAQDAAAFAERIKTGDHDTRLALVEHAPDQGPAALAPLGEVYAGDDPAAGRAAYESMKRIVYHAGRPGAAHEAKAASDALVKLAAAGHPEYVRADCIELLGAVGDKEAAASLAALLTDAGVREHARMAIERMPGQGVDAVLLKAARTCPADYRPNIDLSLRHRHAKMAKVGVEP